jgi:energy-coupling factor transporter ATP-binding protein EcfA2
MKINYLYIKKYNNLENFTIEFKQQLSVIIGVNGSGKSSVLEVLAKLFSAAYLKEKASFGFKITYELGTVQVELSAQDAGSTIQMNGKNKIDPHLLPTNVVIYYSGLSEKMEQICKPYEEKQRKDFQKGNPSKRPFFYYRPENFDMLLLALFAFGFGNTGNFILEKLAVTGLDSFQIALKQPKWKKVKNDERNLWGLEGNMRWFCDVLTSIADRITVDSQRGSIQYHFQSAQKWHQITNYFSEKAIFELLDMLSYEGMLAYIQLSLSKKNAIIDANVLSEGEKQIIAIRGMNDLLIGEHTLLLFDEPDTYLHPSWQSAFMDEIVEYSKHAQFVVTSHSPNIISSLQKMQLNILHQADGKTVTKVFSGNPYGKKFDQILIDYFGLQGLRNAKVTKAFEQLWEMLNHNQYESDAFKTQFETLERQIGKADSDLLTIKLEIARKKKYEKNQ